MVNTHPTLSKAAPGRPSVAGTGWRSARFARSTASSYGFSVERPPVILEWGAWVLRVGHAEQHRPQHVLPWDSSTAQNILSEEEWYLIISPLLTKVWDSLMIDPASRRVVCVTSLPKSRAWEATMQQALWNRGVPAVCFVSCLETVPYAMGWSRGLVVHVGRYEAQCLAICRRLRTAKHLSKYVRDVSDCVVLSISFLQSHEYILLLQSFRADTRRSYLVKETFRPSTPNGTNKWTNIGWMNTIRIV